MMLKMATAIVFFIALSFSTGIRGVSLEEDLTLTFAQKAILDKFRAIVGPSLSQEYMKRDIYLIRWLRARNFNLMESVLLLAENLQWRLDQKIDEISKEDWTDYEERFPYFLEGCDKEGRPVASVNVGEWDVRAAVLVGQRGKLIRYFDKLIEEINVIVRNAQDKGENVTQYTLIFNMANYNLVEQGCSACLPIYFAMFTHYEQYYPGMVHKMFLVNSTYIQRIYVNAILHGFTAFPTAPPLFQTLLSLIKPLLSPLSREALIVQGNNKGEWQRVLLEEIPVEQLSSFYGGQKEMGMEPGEIRQIKEWRCGLFGGEPSGFNDTAITTTPSSNSTNSKENEF